MFENYIDNFSSQTRKTEFIISEQELENVQNLLSNLDRSMGNLMDKIEEMKPAYLHAMKLLSQANPPSAAQKNNLVFYGLAPEPLEVQVSQIIRKVNYINKRNILPFLGYIKDINNNVI